MDVTSWTIGVVAVSLVICSRLLNGSDKKSVGKATNYFGVDSHHMQDRYKMRLGT